MSRVAIIGGGKAATLHAEAALAAPGVDLVGVGGRSPGTASLLARAVEVPDLPLEELVAGADGVVVAIPPRAVAEVLARIPSQCAVLVESPVGLHPGLRSDAMTAVNLLHATATKRALRAIVDLGTAHHLVLRSRSLRPSWGVHGTPAFGGGVLLDPGARLLPLLLAAAAVPVASVSAAIDYDGDGPDSLDVAARLTFAFVDGRRASAELLWTDGPDDTEIEAAGADGVVSVRVGPRPSIEIDGRPIAIDEEPPLVALGFVEQMRRFGAVAGGRAEPWPPLSVGDGAMAIAEAAAESARAGGIPVPATARARRDPAQVRAAPN